MDEKTEHFLRVLGRIPTVSKIEIVDSVNNKTREGNYVKISAGMNISSWFVGEDKQKGKIIAEYVAP